MTYLNLPAELKGRILWDKKTSANKWPGSGSSERRSSNSWYGTEFSKTLFQAVTMHLEFYRTAKLENKK